MAIVGGFLIGFSINSLMTILIFGTPTIRSYIGSSKKGLFRGLSMNINENPDNPLKNFFTVDWDKLDLWQKIVGGIGIALIGIGGLMFLGGAVATAFAGVGAPVAAFGWIIMTIGAAIAGAAFGVDPGEWG